MRTRTRTRTCTIHSVNLSAFFSFSCSSTVVRCQQAFGGENVSIKNFLLSHQCKIHFTHVNVNRTFSVFVEFKIHNNTWLSSDMIFRSLHKWIIIMICCFSTVFIHAWRGHAKHDDPPNRWIRRCFECRVKLHDWIDMPYFVDFSSESNTFAIFHEAFGCVSVYAHGLQ